MPLHSTNISTRILGSVRTTPQVQSILILTLELHLVGVTTAAYAILIPPTTATPAAIRHYTMPHNSKPHSSQHTSQKAHVVDPYPTQTTFWAIATLRKSKPHSSQHIRQKAHALNIDERVLTVYSFY